MVHARFARDSETAESKPIQFNRPNCSLYRVDREKSQHRDDFQKLDEGKTAGK